MPRVRFSGRVFPFVYDVTIKEHPKVTWFDDETDTTIKFEVSIKNGEIEIDCDLDRYDEEKYIASLYMRAYDVVRTSLDLVAFNTGYGLTVLIENYTGPFGETRPFVVQDLQLAALCSAFSSFPAKSRETNNFESILKICLSDWKIGHSLREMIEAITLPHVSTVNCARAIEGLRTLIAPGPRRQAWPTFRNALQLSEAYLGLILDNSTETRHGNRVRVTGAITTEIVRRSWSVMDRFLEYKKRGDRPLPQSEFPLLTG